MKIMIRGLLMAFVAGVLIVNVGWTAGTATLTKTQDYGIVTYKFAIESDSNEALGHYHKSSGALKTDWVDVPFGTPYAIYFETADAESLASAYSPWGPDTIGLALETAPVTGLAIDSSGDYKRNKADVLWDLRSLTWTDFTGQHYFPATFQDTNYQSIAAAAANTDDTAAIAASSLKGNGIYDVFGAVTPLVNLGKLRFSVCVDAADSVLDGVLRMNCYIVFKAPERKEYIQFDWSIPVNPTWVYLRLVSPIVDRPWLWRERELR